MSGPFGQRRGELLRRLESGVAVIPTSTLKQRNADTEFRFRPESDFHYLTGFAEPDAVLVLAPGRADGEAVLFLQPRDPAAETWTGRRLGVERAPEVLDVDQAFPIGELDARLPDLLRGAQPLWFRTGRRPDLDRLVLATLETLRFKPTVARAAPEAIRDPSPLLHEMRLFKAPEELAALRTAAAITRDAHLRAMREAAPGRFEYEIEALLEYEFRRRGGTGPAYGSIVASGANATVLHYVTNDRRMQAGELLLIDAGCEYDYYAADVTRTFPVDGTFTPEQQAVYDLVLAAQAAGLAAVAPGRRFHEVHDAALRVLAQGMLDLDLLTGSLDEVLEQGTYRRFYMHKSGHWLGLDVHDAGAYFLEGSTTRPLEPGMVLTVEPGFYVAPDDADVPPAFRGIGVRIEDDVLVTADGHENLTADIPKEVPAVLAATAGTPARNGDP